MFSELEENSSTKSRHDQSNLLSIVKKTKSKVHSRDEGEEDTHIVVQKHI